jgi:hypothetical protein
MNTEQLIWSAFNSAMVPLAQRAVKDLEDVQRGAAVGSKVELPTDAGVKLKEALQSINSTAPPLPPVAAVALGEDYDGVFKEARQQVSWYFRLHLVLAIGLIAIFLIGVGGAVVSAIVEKGASIWSAIFGGVSITSAFGIFATRPLQMIQAAIIVANRIDLVQLRYKGDLEDCTQFATLDEKRTCREKAWTAMKQELDLLHKTSP